MVQFNELPDIVELKKKLRDLGHEIDEEDDAEQKLEELILEFDKKCVEDDKLDAEMADVRCEIMTADIARVRLQRLSTIPGAVVPFMARIEKANAYFEFKKAAKEKYWKQFKKQRTEVVKIQDTLIKDGTFGNGVGESGIRQAGIAIYWELLDEIPRFRMEKKRKDLALEDPVFDLVFQTREQGYSMDQNPEVELRKMMEAYPGYYDMNFGPKLAGEEYCLTEIKLARDKYSEFWSKYVKVANGAEPAVGNADNVASSMHVEVKEALKPTDQSYSTADSARIHEPRSNAPENEEALCQKIKGLCDKLVILEKEKEELEVKINIPGDGLSLINDALFKLKQHNCIEAAVPLFVSEVEKADRYFEFKKAAKIKYGKKFAKIEKVTALAQITDTLRDDRKLKLPFDNQIGELEIQQAAAAMFWELVDGPCSGRNKKKRQDPVLDNAIYKIVFEAREKVRVINKEPVDELLRMTTVDPRFYNNRFVFGNVGKMDLDYEQARMKYFNFWLKYNPVAPVIVPAVEMVNDASSMPAKDKKPSDVSHDSSSAKALKEEHQSTSVKAKQQSISVKAKHYCKVNQGHHQGKLRGKEG